MKSPQSRAFSCHLIFSELDTTAVVGGFFIFHIRSKMLSLTLLLLLGSSHGFSPIRNVGSLGRTAPAAVARSKLLTVTSNFVEDIWNGKEVVESGLVQNRQKFDWFKAWYPVVPVEILDREKPHRFELLGQSIVVWNDGPVENNNGLFQSKKSRRKGSKRIDGNWRVFVDECPHRKVPLSEGRVEDDGSLLCSYHAWRFNGEGSCISVPQINVQENADTLTRILNNPKTSCNAFPTKVVDGLLFVWPSSDANATLESELTPLPLPKQSGIATTNGRWEGPWNYRELPYSADYFFENVVDPAHVGVSHHSIIGSRYDVRPLRLATSMPVCKEGFAFESFQNATQPDQVGSTVSYIAPGLVTIDVPIGTDGAQQTLELYASPSRPGFCNHVGRMVVRKDQKGTMPQLLRQFTLPMPIWLSHVLASFFLNQDGVFLHHQERSLATTGRYSTLVPDEADPYQYDKAVFLVPSDLGVISFRNWVRFIAGGRIPYRNNHVMPTASSDVVFDAWNAHTKYCQYCQVALKRLKAVRMVTFIAASSIAITRPSNAFRALVSSLGLAGIGLLLNKLIGMFYRYECSHAHND
jgi:phenylpropionate dioxygenase-like ring-hydroxylating dioxygenase large terminal subunit